MTYLSVQEPGFWLVVSLVSTLAILVLRSHTPASIQPWLLVANWVLFPYLALITGAVSPRLMGLAMLDWPATFRLGVGLAVGVLALGIIGMLMVPRRQESQPETNQIANNFADKGLAAAIAIALAGTEEFYWCFLRGSIWEIALTLPQSVELPGYWAVWIAALLALPGVLWIQPSGARRLIKVAILVITSILFFYTRNFWLCWFIHATLWLALAGISTHLQAELEEESDQNDYSKERK